MLHGREFPLVELAVAAGGSQDFTCSRINSLVERASAFPCPGWPDDSAEASSVHAMCAAVSGTDRPLSMQHHPSLVPTAIIVEHGVVLRFVPFYKLTTQLNRRR
jgi:hypothetical protein